MIKKAHSWFKLRKVLEDCGISISKPLFHGTTLSKLTHIYTEGLKSNSLENNAICFSRSLDYYANNNLSLGWTWNKKSAILIFEERDLMSRFKSRPFNWYYLAQPDTVKEEYSFGINKSLFEFEERVYPRELTIPPKYIKAIIFGEYQQGYENAILYLNTDYFPMDKIKDTSSKEILYYLNSSHEVEGLLQELIHTDIDFVIKVLNHSKFRYLTPNMLQETLHSLSESSALYLLSRLKGVIPTSVLISSIRRGSVSLVEYLLDALDIYHMDAEHLSIALSVGNKKIITLMLSKGYNRFVKQLSESERIELQKYV